jgi:hypothetical protein
MAYSSGKYAYGICDRTGFRYKIKDLVFEVENGVRTGLRVGYDVVDQDHPQNFLGRLKIDDTQSLLDARPDRSEPAQRDYYLLIHSQLQQQIVEVQ